MGNVTIINVFLKPMYNGGAPPCSRMWITGVYSETFQLQGIKQGVYTSLSSHVADCGSK